LFRIVFGLVVLDSLIGKFPDRLLFYSDVGLVTRQTILQFWHGPLENYNLLYLVPANDPQLFWFFVALIGLSVCLTFGLFTRVTSVLLFLGLIALSNRNFAADNSGDDLIRINCFWLMFSQAGAAFSLDRILFKKSRPNLISAWPVRMLQLQLAYVYLDSVYLKLQGPAWRDGTALYYALHYLELKRFNFDFLFHSIWQIKLATWSVLIIEASMFSLVWLKRFRYWCLGAAFLMHVGINLAMQFPIFEYVMIASLIVFIDPEHKA
jgi:uncharacterized membrane protein YphA (DoxX/SURF4 family)